MKTRILLNKNILEDGTYGTEYTYEVNDVTMEIQKFVAAMNILGKETEWYLHCDEAILNEAKDILKNIFEI